MPALSPRLSLIYVTVFAVLGVFGPWWPVWLEGRGLSPSEIARLVALGIVVRIVAGPWLGRWADRNAAHRRLLCLLSLGSIVACALFLLPVGYWGILLITVAFSALYPPMIPLLDGITVLWGRKTPPGSLDYSRIRLWGSLAFLAANVVAGVFLEGRTREWVIGLMLIALVGCALASLVVPDPGGVVDPRAALFRALLRRRDFMAVLITAMLIQGSHGCFYSFSAIWWEQAGIARSTIGLLWAEGVIAEVLLFALAATFVPWRPITLLAIGAVAAGVRWTVMAETSSVGALAAVQWLHALSFGMTHLASIRWIARYVPEGQTATAQTLLAAIAMGVGTGIATLVSGELFESYGAGAFYSMVAMGALGLVGALVLLPLTAGRRPETPSSP